MRLGAIDIGSNSVHMIIADVTADGGIAVVERVKEMVRLGRGVFTKGRISADSAELAIRALRTFVRLARVRGVERLRAVATSAVREASNGTAFIRRVREETGIRARIISGREEARLIYRAAAHSLGLDEHPYLLVDVGGGSVEVVLVSGGRPLWFESLPLGVARLTEQFLPGDPPSPKQCKRLKSHLRAELSDLLPKIKQAGAVRAVGTSGTVHAILTMACAYRGDEGAQLHGATAATEEVSHLRREVLSRGSLERLDLPGVDPKRSDLLPAATLLVETILRGAGVKELVGCTWALREGMLLALARVPTAIGGGREAVRRRSVDALAAHFLGDNAHGRQSAWLATHVFDATAEALRLPERCRELLEYAALLHDVGRAIDHERHHQHSAYLIRHGELLHFDPEEVEIIAEVARGHRKQAPKRSNPALQALPRGTRKMIRTLAVILRLADALDRTHFGVIKEIRCRLTGRRLTIEFEPTKEGADLEMWAAQRRLDALSRLLEREVILRPRERRARRLAGSARATG